LDREPRHQIDTDARSTKKRGTWYFGYKGHIGVDIGSKLIRKLTFTPAHEHDSTQTEALVSYDEGSLFGDKAYFDSTHKYSARKYGWYYGVLDKPARGQKLSNKQKKRNRKHSRVPASVEHPFAWMKTKVGLTVMRAKNQARNQLRFLLTCTLWNLSRAAFPGSKIQTNGIGSSMNLAKSHKKRRYRSSKGRWGRSLLRLDAWPTLRTESFGRKIPHKNEIKEQ